MERLPARDPAGALPPGLSGLRRGADPGARTAGHARRRHHDHPPDGGGRPRAADRRPTSCSSTPTARSRSRSPSMPTTTACCASGSASPTARPGAVTLHEVAAASPLLATARAPPDPLRRGRLGRRVDHDDRGAHAGHQGGRVARRRTAAPALLPLLPARSRRVARGIGAARSWPARWPGVATPASPSSGRPPRRCGSGAGTTRRPPSTCSTPAPPSSPPSRSGCGRPRAWARSAAASTAGSAPTPCATATRCARSWSTTGRPPSSRSTPTGSSG